MAHRVGSNEKLSPAETDSTRTMRAFSTQEQMDPRRNEQQINTMGSHAQTGYQASDEMFVNEEDDFITHGSSRVNDRHSEDTMDMSMGPAGVEGRQLRATRAHDTDYMHTYAADCKNHQTHRDNDNSYDQEPQVQPRGHRRASVHMAEPHLNYGLQPSRSARYHREEQPSAGPHSFIRRNESPHYLESDASIVHDEEEGERAVPQNRRRTMSRGMKPDHEYRGDYDRFTNAQDDLESFVDDHDYEDDDDHGYDDDIDLSGPSRRSTRQAIIGASRHPATRPDTVQVGHEFAIPNNNRRLSRYAGIPIKAGVNKVPFRIPDASLEKRNLTRLGEDVIGKRASGANDPENIMIVNMFENEGMRWAEIAQSLNELRVQNGRVPTFTPNSIHNRYNRNAPLLFAAEGKTWVPICDRSNTIISPPEPLTMWNPELDRSLVRITKQVESAKWNTVATMFNSENGMMISPMAAANRHLLI